MSLFGRKFKRRTMSAVDKELVDRLLGNMQECYANKSSDEYKCKGDIRKSPLYDKIEVDLAKLSLIKKLPESDIKALKDLFNTLHRSIFSKMVTEYISEPNERNIIFTTAFTTGYRLLVGELSRIESSTEATDKGLVYKPGKIDRSDAVIEFIKQYNEDIDKRIDQYIRNRSKNDVSVTTESAIEAITGGANLVVGVVEGVFGVFNNIFSSAKSLNPIALISAVLSRSYDKKVAQYEKIHNEYDAAVKAYEEYKKIPESQRKKKIEHNYVKMIEKYNIKMGNLKAQIDHYDQRAQEHTKDSMKSSSSSKSSGSKEKENKNLPQSSSTVDTSKDDKDSNSSSDDIDF